MSDPEVEEFRLLRHRAYGPAADIHSDPKALQRLRELEHARSEPAAFIAPETEADRIEWSSSDQESEQPSSTSDPPSSPQRGWRRIPIRPRRSTVLIVLAVALLVAAAIVALTLVQRVQTDPLQVGASQVARLSADSGVDVSAALSRDGAGELLAFRDFHGVRTVIEEADETGSSDECMTIYQPELLIEGADGGYSYSGRLFLTACAAGPFPAAITFAVLDDFPEPMRNAYPVGTPLQFVYDRVNNEVVIFQG